MKQQNWTGVQADIEVNEIVAIATSLDMPDCGVTVSEFASIVTGDQELVHQIEMIEVRA